jgi:hypothetical protein
MVRGTDRTEQNLFVEEAFLASSRSLSLFSLMLCLINFSDTLTGIGASGSSPEHSPSSTATFLCDRECPLPSQLFRSSSRRGRGSRHDEYQIRLTFPAGLVASSANHDVFIPPCGGRRLLLFLSSQSATWPDVSGRQLSKSITIVFENQPQSYLSHAQAYCIPRGPKGLREDITI